MNCYDCVNAHMLDKPKMFPEDGYGIYGYCSKNNGNYPIYIPSGKCKDHSIIKTAGAVESHLPISFIQPSIFDFANYS